MKSLEFRNVGFNVKIGTGKDAKYKTILSNINGSIESGELVALIGSSGAGKTTLLNLLSGRILGGTVTGDILFNGEKRDKKTFKRDVAYVEQDDLLFGTLTTKETLMYAADFRLDASEYTKQEKEDRVKDVMRSLRLTKSEDTLIGFEGHKGLSGGERKRVSIGVEIVTDPKMIMLDEPTSGLDSNSSEVIVKLMKSIAVKKDLICISSIHQPSSKIFYTFDKVMLLAPGGVVYFGSTRDVLPYFSSIGFEAPIHENPADFLIDIMTIDYENEENLQNSMDRVDRLKSSWAEYVSENGEIYKSNISAGTSMTSFNPDQSEPKNTEFDGPTEVWKNPWLSELRILTKRSWLRQMRDKSFLYSQAFSCVFGILLIGFTFFKRADGFSDAQNKIGLLFLLVLHNAFPVAMPVVPVLIEERGIMIRERASGSYRMSTFLFSNILTQAPIALASNITSLTAIYYLGKLQFHTGKYFTFIAIYIVVVMNSLGIAFVFSAASPNMRVAAMFTPLFLTVFAIYGGALVNATAVTPILSWIRYLDYMYFSYTAALQNEMKGLVFDCSKNTSGTCYPTGESVVLSFNLNLRTVWESFFICLGMAIFYHILAYAIIRFKTKPKYILV
ncbi:ATP-binding cassette sub-family G member 2 [Smittium mucronatum]|uniref:ATP-binding cassette sub-family G member 2 n=1 Tax=Smittium mucronatum TaxID=133383 RepID=A0A1R0GLD2_9FUNG|nr:ATP-binding cassette sub-family G member 2 [Smittium mucronatum]